MSISKVPFWTNSGPSNMPSTLMSKYFGDYINLIIILQVILSIDDLFFFFFNYKYKTCICK